jgi:hypothetical protein
MKKTEDMCISISMFLTYNIAIGCSSVESSLIKKSNNDEHCLKATFNLEVVEVG